MKIRLLMSWSRYRKGHELDCPDGQANLLIRRNIAALVEEEKPQPKKRSK
jgi:hypothetical protein